MTQRTVHAMATRTEVQAHDTEQADGLAIERRAIDVTPEAERHGTPRSQVTRIPFPTTRSTP